MTLHLSGALAAGDVVGAVQVVAGALPSSQNDFEYSRSHACIDLSPSGEYLLVTDLWGSESASPFNKLNINPSLVIYQSSSLNGFAPVTEVALDVLSPGTTVTNANYYLATDLLHDWYFLDNETIVGATKTGIPSLGTSGAAGNLIFITGSGDSWGISYHITSSGGFGPGNDSKSNSSQRGTNQADDLPLSGDNFNVGTNSADGAVIGNWGDTDADHWKVTPNNTHTNTPATRLAVHTTKRTDAGDNGYGSDFVTIFKKLEGETEFSFHSQFSPEDMNINLDTDNQFWSVDLANRAVQDMVFIEEDIIVVAYMNSDLNVTDLAPFKYDDSDNKWKPFGYTGTRLTGLDGVVSRALTDIRSHGYRWLEYDPHSERLFIGTDSNTINIFNSSSDWLTSLYDGSGNLETPSETETYPAFSIGTGQRNAWSMPRNTKWRFTPGHAVGISVPVHKSTGGTSSGKIPVSKVFWHESSSLEGWSTYSTSDNYFKVADINENGNSLTGRNDGIATMTTSARTGTSSKYGNFFGWNSQGGGTGDVFVYKEANADSGDSQNFSTSRLIVLDLNSQPAMTVPTITVTPDPDPPVLSEATPGTTVSATVTLNTDPGADTVNVVASLSSGADISVDTSSQQITTTNFDTGVAFVFTVTGDNFDEDTETITVTFTTQDSANADLNGLTAQLSIEVQDDDTAGISTTAENLTIVETEEQQIANIFVSLDSEPTSDVVLSVATNLDASRVSVPLDNITFTPAAHPEQKTLTLIIPGNAVDQDDHSGTITLSVIDGQSAAEFAGLSKVINVTLQEDDEAGLTVTSDSPINLNESAPGNSATITVELDSQPASGVVVVDIDATALAGRATLAGATLANSRLEFTTENWSTPQTVTLTAVSDDIDKDPITNADLVFSVNDDLTADAKFDPLSHTVQVNITDDDTANFTVTSDDPINLTEGGAAAEITVVLTSEPESGAVRVDISPQGDLVGRLTVPAHLDFDDTNWNTPRQINISVPEDQEANDDASGILRFAINAAASSDEFDALASHDVTVNITADAADVAGLEITPADFRIVTKEEGRTKATLTVRLRTSPAAPVTVTLVGSLRNGEHTMTPNPVSFEFDENNFSVARVVTFQGIEDNEPDGDSIYTMTLTATSADAKYNNLTQEITLVNEDSGTDAGAGSDQEEEDGGPEVPGGDGGDEGDEGGSEDNVPPDTPPGGDPDPGRQDPFTPGPRGPQIHDSPFTGILGNIYQPTSMDDKIPKKIHFEPSTIESIDRAVYEYVSKLKLSTDTNEGFKEVPVIWGTSERSFLSKREPLDRDNQGLLKLPVITIRRTGMDKAMASKGIFQGNVPENPDEQGGSLVVSRVINQEKSSAYAEALRKRTTLGRGAPIVSSKTVYRTISAPMPVNVEMSYDIAIRTEYQQQMNDLVLPFATKTGTINYVKLKSNGHRYEGFIDGQFTTQDNLSDYTTDERKFETIIKFRVIGYLVGQDKNREKPHYSIRENFVEIKIPRESVIVDPKEIEKYKL